MRVFSSRASAFTRPLAAKWRGERGFLARQSRKTQFGFETKNRLALRNQPEMLAFRILGFPRGARSRQARSFR